MTGFTNVAERLREHVEVVAERAMTRMKRHFPHPTLKMRLRHENGGYAVDVHMYDCGTHYHGHAADRSLLGGVHGALDNVEAYLAHDIKKGEKRHRTSRRAAVV